jgi:hypothetical protein
LDNCGGRKKTGEIIKVDGKKYEVVKFKVDTVEVYKTKTKTIKGENIPYKTIEYDTIYEKIDTLQLLKDFYAKNIYNDTLKLEDSLGYIALTDTITRNKILTRTWNSKVKEKVINTVTVVKDPPKTQLYLGLNTTFDAVDLINGVGGSLLIKSKKDNIIQLGVGISNKNNSSTQVTPYYGAGFYWRIKRKK